MLGTSRSAANKVESTDVEDRDDVEPGTQEKWKNMDFITRHVKDLNSDQMKELYPDYDTWEPAAILRKTCWYELSSPLGSDCRLAARSYGLPQFHLWTFFWGACRNEMLPSFPLPNHEAVGRNSVPFEFEGNIVAPDENNPGNSKDAVRID